MKIGEMMFTSDPLGVFLASSIVVYVVQRTGYRYPQIKKVSFFYNAVRDRVHKRRKQISRDSLRKIILVLSTMVDMQSENRGMTRRYEQTIILSYKHRRQMQSTSVLLSL